MKTFVTMMVFCVALAAPLAARQGNGQGQGQGRGQGQGQGQGQCQRQGQGQGKGGGQQCTGQCDRTQCQNCPNAASCPRAQVKK